MKHIVAYKSWHQCAIKNQQLDGSEAENLMPWTKLSRSTLTPKGRLWFAAAQRTQIDMRITQSQ